MPNQKITISTILDEFENTQFAKEGGSCFECCDYERMYKGLEDFITHALKQYSEAVRVENPDGIRTSWKIGYDDAISDQEEKEKCFWEEK